MNLEEIYRLVEDSKSGSHLLNGLGETYKLDFEDFQNSNGHYHDTGEGRSVSRKMLMETTEQVVEAIPEYQSILKSLETAHEDVQDYSTSRVIEGERVEPKELEEEIEDLIDIYRENLRNIWSTAYRARKDPDIEFDPIEARYKSWRRQRNRRNERSGDAVRHFFGSD